jgi:hypothetical protein
MQTHHYNNIQSDYIGRPQQRTKRSQNLTASWNLKLGTSSAAFCISNWIEVWMGLHGNKVGHHLQSNDIWVKKQIKERSPPPTPNSPLNYSTGQKATNSYAYDKVNKNHQSRVFVNRQGAGAYHSFFCSWPFLVIISQQLVEEVNSL